MKRTTKWIAAGALALAFSGSPAAFAHGTGSQIMGTVTAVTANSITVRAEDGDIVPVPVDGATTYLRGAKAKTHGDVTVGTRVVIDVGGEPGSTTAKSVRLGAAPAATHDGKAASNGGGADAPAGHDHDHDHGH